MNNQELNDLIVAIQNIITEKTGKTLDGISKLAKDERTKIINIYGGEDLNRCMEFIRSYVLQQMVSMLFKREDREDACSEFMADRFYKSLLTFDINNDKCASFLTYIKAPIRQTAIDYYNEHIKKHGSNIKPRGGNEEELIDDELYFGGENDTAIEKIVILMAIKSGFDSLHSTNYEKFNYILAFHLQVICRFNGTTLKPVLKSHINKKSLNSEIIKLIYDAYSKMSTYKNVADEIFITIEKHPDYNNEIDKHFFEGNDFNDTVYERIRSHCEKIRASLINNIQY